MGDGQKESRRPGGRRLVILGYITVLFLVLPVEDALLVLRYV